MFSERDPTPAIKNKMATEVAVHYGAMGYLDYFRVKDISVAAGDPVIIRTDRGVEWGVVVARINLEEAKPKGEVLRKATAQDRQKLDEISEKNEVEEFERCNALISKFGLPMKLIKVEHLFGGHKIIFFFSSEKRVDFRRIVKELAQHYKTRIEMRQIGVRDEARLLGEYGPCGRKLCCHTFLNALKPVSIKAAKSQKSTLDPSKISGCCGRLKCCLKFEEETYRELRKHLPRPGKKINTGNGPATVIGCDIITQTVTVRYEDKTEKRFPAKELSKATEDTSGST